jgi:hypothetical protein
MAAEYYTAASVFSQLLSIAEIDVDYAPPPFPEDWELCPCIKMEKGICHSGRCRVKIGVFFHNPLLSRFPIEIIYIRERHGGFIRADTPRLKNLIDDGVINKADLISEIF